MDDSYEEVLTNKSQKLADLWFQWDGKSEESFTSDYHDLSIVEKEIFFAKLVAYYNISHPPGNDVFMFLYVCL